MTKQKKHIEYLESPEQIEAFFKAVGREDLASGFDIRSDKSFTFSDGKRKSKHKKFKASRAKKYNPAKSDRYIDGYATTPDVDWVKDSVSLDAMKGAETHLLRKGTNTVFYNHDTEQPIGKVVGVWVDKKGMFVQIVISKADDVKNIWTKIQEKILSSYSIRFITKKVKVERDGDYNVISYSIEKMEMLEVSVVGLPMNKEANIVNVRGKSIKSLFKQKGVKDMTKEKKETITSVVKEILPEMLTDGMADSLKEFGDTLIKQMEEKFEAKEVADPEAEKKALEDEVKSLKKALKDAKKKDADEDDADDDDADEDEEDEESEESKAMKKEIDTLKKKLAKKSEGKKKGADADDSDDDNEGDCKKALKDIDDDATCMFVLKAMKEDNSLYEALTDGEKQKCRHLFFQMMKAEKE